MQVHDVLIAHNVITNTELFGHCESYQWVAEADWVYQLQYEANDLDQTFWITLEGLDTLATVYINGVIVGSHQNMYIPAEWDISKLIKPINTLLIHFHSPFAYIDDCVLPEKWDGVILKRKTLRKAQHDFDGYLGAKPYSTPIGVFRDVVLQSSKYGWIKEFNVDSQLKYNFSIGEIFASIICEGISADDNDAQWEITVLDPSGVQQAHVIGVGQNVQKLTIAAPRLWYPIGYGEQPLYQVSAKLLHDGYVVDEIQKKIGFRDIQMQNWFEFRVNNVPIRLWGANFAPIEGISHCWNSKRYASIFQYVVMGHMNVLRIWGEGIPCPDELYDMADAAGVLLWFDFYGESKMHPDSAAYIAQCAAEAEYHVKHHLHRPSILMWCGGNEMQMWAEIDHPGDPIVGEEIYLSAYTDVCARLDPKRFYLKNSPFGGSFCNDPLIGDTHGYDHHSNFVPGIQYPIMFSENTRVSAPAIQSMKQFLSPEELWPSNWSGRTTHGQTAVPPAWIARSANLMWQKFGPVEHFYDPLCAEDLVYSMGAARGGHMRDAVERCRRGRPSLDGMGKNRCFGHMVWKLNDTWPQIYTSVIDYYLDAYIPYYEMKRAYQPILLSFDVQDQIHVWVTNDTPHKITGKVIFKLFHMKTNQYSAAKQVIVEVEPCSSKPVMDLYDLGQIPRVNVLCAWLVDESGLELTAATELLDIERNLTYPDAVLTMDWKDHSLTISSDRFARCIELSGDAGGERFGWIFEDNYFDLLPGVTKTVHIFGDHTEGTITAKPHFSTTSAQIVINTVNKRTHCV